MERVLVCEFLAGDPETNLLHFLPQAVFVKWRHPVDKGGKPVLSSCKLPGSPGAEFEDDRTAHAPMGDQQRPGLLKAGTCYPGHGVFNSYTHEDGNGITGHVKGEQGGHWFFNGMP